jgi:hypothetical protein
MLIKPGVYPSEDSQAVRRLERVYEEYTVIQRNIFGCIWCYWSIVDKVTDNCQWLEYLFIDILNTDEVEVLYALSLFTFSSHMSDMTQNNFFIGHDAFYFASSKM